MVFFAESTLYSVPNELRTINLRQAQSVNIILFICTAVQFTGCEKVKPNTFNTLVSYSMMIFLKACFQWNKENQGKARESKYINNLGKSGKSALQSILTGKTTEHLAFFIDLLAFNLHWDTKLYQI